MAAESETRASAPASPRQASTPCVSRGWRVSGHAPWVLQDVSSARGGGRRAGGPRRSHGRQRDAHAGAQHAAALRGASRVSTARAAGATPADRRAPTASAPRRRSGRRRSASATAARLRAAAPGVSGGGGRRRREHTHQRLPRCALVCGGTRRQRRGWPAVRRSLGRKARPAVRCRRVGRRHVTLRASSRGSLRGRRTHRVLAPERQSPTAAAQRAPCGPPGCCRCWRRWRCAARRTRFQFRQMPLPPTPPRATSSSATPAMCSPFPT